MSSVDYSHWMQDLAHIIGDVPLNQLPIPGSHDSWSWMPTTSIHARRANI
jgi:hypothetical protein